MHVRLEPRHGQVGVAGLERVHDGEVAVGDLGEVGEAPDVLHNEEALQLAVQERPDAQEGGLIGPEQKAFVEGHVVLHERVFRSSNAEPFEVMSIYSFEGDKVSRVEFVR